MAFYNPSPFNNQHFFNQTPTYMHNQYLSNNHPISNYNSVSYINYRTEEHP